MTIEPGTPPPPPKTGGELWKKIEQLQRIAITIAALYFFFNGLKSWFGSKELSPAAAVDALAQNVILLTKQMQRTDSLNLQRQAQLEKLGLQNSYSICILAKRPQSECADIIFTGTPRPTR